MPSPAPVPHPSIADLVVRLRGAPPRLGDARLVLVDGPAGAGKSTLAERLGAATGSEVVHGDDLLAGWDGLPRIHEALIPLLEALARDGEASFERWDWERDRRGDRVRVSAGKTLIVEGVGVGQARARPYASLLVFVEVPWEERLRRGIERDASAYDNVEDRWRGWDRAERAHFAAEATREAADVVVDGTRPVPD